MGMEEDMAQWVHHLRIKDAWKQTQDGSMSIQELAKQIVTQLKAFNIQNDSKLDQIIEDFEFLDEDADNDDFDYIMQNLYDWADIPLDNQWNGRKNCWIETL